MGCFCGSTITPTATVYFVQFFYKEMIIFPTNTTAEVDICNTIWNFCITAF